MDPLKYIRHAVSTFVRLTEVEETDEPFDMDTLTATLDTGREMASVMDLHWISWQERRMAPMEKNRKAGFQRTRDGVIVRSQPSYHLNRSFACPSEHIGPAVGPSYLLIPRMQMS